MSMFYSLEPGNVNMLGYMADGMSAGSQLKLRWGDDSGSSEWVQCNQKGPIWWKREIEERLSEACNVRKT